MYNDGVNVQSLFLVGLIVFVALLAVLLLAAWWLKRWVVSLVVPQGDGLSPLAAFVQSASRLMASELSASLKASLMGQMSGIARSLDGAQADVVGDMVGAANPWVGALLELSPSLKKRIGRMNPMAVMALSNALSGLGKKNGAGSPGGQSSSQMELFNK